MERELTFSTSVFLDDALMEDDERTMCFVDIIDLSVIE
jgi:hypothetical protein